MATILPSTTLTAGSTYKETATVAHKFTGSFTQQEAIPANAVCSAMAVLQSGRLHRYNLFPREAETEVAS